VLSSEDCSFGAAWGSCVGAGACFKSATCNGLRAEFDGVGAIGRALAGTIGRPTFDGHCGYGSQSDQAGAYQCYEYVTRGGYGARAKMARVAEPTDLVMVT